MKQQGVYFVMGVSGSGKSTIGRRLADALNWRFFDGDDYHPEANITKMATGRPLNDVDRKDWLISLNALAHEQQSFGAVIACSALKEVYRETLRAGLGALARFIYLKGTYQEILARMEQREDHFMPSSLLKSQFETLEPPMHAIEIPTALEPDKALEMILKEIGAA